MRDLVNSFLISATDWTRAVVGESRTRFLDAVDKIESKDEQYTTENLIEDSYHIWKKALSTPPLTSVGGFPYSAFIRVDRWRGQKTSNPVPTGVPKRVKITRLVRVGSKNKKIPRRHVKIKRGSASVVVRLVRLGRLLPKPPKNGHYVGLLWDDDGIIAKVHVLVDVKRRRSSS